MSVKAILMKDQSMVKSACTILGRLAHSYLGVPKEQAVEELVWDHIDSE